MLRKWIDNRVSAYLVLNGVDVDEKDYDKLVEEVELQVTEKMDEIIMHAVHGIVTKA